MRIYKCDSCGKEMKKPAYKIRTQRLVLGDELDSWDSLYVRQKIHLCKDCFRGLYVIAKKREEEEKREITRMTRG